jgi:site-specific recombinase XerD
MTPLRKRMIEDLQLKGMGERTQEMYVHTLRHSYATHLLEAGVNLKLIQKYLGHNTPTTTSIYTHLTDKAIQTATDTINELMKDL